MGGRVGGRMLKYLLNDIEAHIDSQSVSEVRGRGPSTGAIVCCILNKRFVM